MDDDIRYILSSFRWKEVAYIYQSTFLFKSFFLFYTQLNFNLLQTLNPKHINNASLQDSRRRWHVRQGSQEASSEYVYVASFRNTITQT